MLDHAPHAVAGEDAEVHERARRRRQHVLFHARLEHRGRGGRAEHRVSLRGCAELAREDPPEQPAVRHDEPWAERHLRTQEVEHGGRRPANGDRKSTRLNSSHVEISYAVFCLKKKKKDILRKSLKKKKKKKKQQ